MSCAEEALIGEPVVQLKPKRSWDEIPVEFDWHDYLIRLPRRGTSMALNERVRLLRARSTGLQYRVTTAGVTGNKEPRWPTVSGAIIADGTVVLTAEAIDAQSLRTTITDENFIADTGVTLGVESNDDLLYRVLVSGGMSAQTYKIRHQVTLANGEDKEAVGILPVQD